MRTWKIEETVTHISKATNRGYVEAHPVSAFDEGYKLFVQGIYNLTEEEAQEVIRLLSEKNICAEIVYNGDTLSTWLTICFLIWKG